MSWRKIYPNAKPSLLPSQIIAAETAKRPPKANVRVVKPASNNGHGTDDTLKVTQALEGNGITCCLVGISALIFYGAARVRPDWEICVPTELIDKAREVISKESFISEYCINEPWQYWDRSLVQTYERYQNRETDHCFVLVPSRDVHIECLPSNITRSVRGLPYPTMSVFVQSSLDTLNLQQLVDTVDGANLCEDWAEADLQLDGTNDMQWAEETNQRGREWNGGEIAHFGSWLPTGQMVRRQMWEDAVRTKEKRLDWTKPKDIFITQYRIIGLPDSWTVLSDLY